jgi:hypothetical protein
MQCELGIGDNDARFCQFHINRGERLPSALKFGKPYPSGDGPRTGIGRGAIVVGALDTGWMRRIVVPRPQSPSAAQFQTPGEYQ